MCVPSTNSDNKHVPPGLQRGLAVLQLLADYPEGLRFSDIQHQLSLSKTACTRVLHHLNSLDFYNAQRHRSSLSIWPRLPTISAGLFPTISAPQR